MRNFFENDREEEPEVVEEEVSPARQWAMDTLDAVYSERVEKLVEEAERKVENDPLGLVTEYIWKDILDRPGYHPPGKHRREQHEILQKEEE